MQLARAQDLLQHNPTQARKLLNDTQRCPINLHHFAWRFLYGLTKRNKLTPRGHTDVVLAVAYAPDGQTLASGSEDDTIKLWDVRTRQEQ